ncbi:MAG: hypothetical protein ABI791_04055 [Acidobacteriota bacterium]
MAAFFAVLIVVACSPVWGVGYFINQDGSGHVHSAFLMTELLKGDPTLSEFYVLNSISMPNASGHWILMVLLQLFSAFTVTKIMVTLTFAGFVLGVGWLRYSTVGNDGLKTSLLIGTAMAFNWLWLVGFYNFIVGSIVFLAAIGLYYKWREHMTAWRTAALSGLLLFGYLSHIVSFLALAGSVVILSVFVANSSRVRTVLLSLVAFVPVIPHAIVYKQMSEKGEGFSPVWRSLSDPYSLISWIHQVRSADPFIIISRKAFPFVSTTSDYFAIFTPGLWLVIALVLLGIATWLGRSRNNEGWKANYPFIILAAGSLILAAFAPDDFVQTNGGVLRERLLMFGFLFFIPIIRTDGAPVLKRAAQFCLVFVILFQTLAVWDYALLSNREAKEFLVGAEELRKSPSSMLITVDSEPLRFHASTIPQLNCYNGIGNNNIIWDNYEFGHYLFPVVTRNVSDRRFIHDLTTSEYLLSDLSADEYEDKINRLNSSLASYNGRIETAAVWGQDPHVEAVLSQWFETEPYFQNGRLRLFRHKHAATP